MKSTTWPIVDEIVTRLGLGILTLFFVSIVIFTSVSFLPGSYANVVLGQAATPETVAALNKELGLDEPAPVRYVKWISGAVTGDFGNSYAGGSQKRPVSQIIGTRLYNTLFLAALTAICAVPIAIGLGLLTALLRGTLADRLLNMSALALVSLPEFFIAYLLTFVVVTRDTYASGPAFPSAPDWLNGLISTVANHIPNFPTLVVLSPGIGLTDRLWNCALPVLTLTLVIIAHMMRMTRSAVVNLLNTPYVEMARLKGSSPRQVILRHALPNAWAPISYVVAVNLAYLITGVVVVEAVFVYPGIGQLMVDAVRSRDIPVVQACALIFASAYIILNLCADIVTIFTNPRLLHPR